VDESMLDDTCWFLVPPPDGKVEYFIRECGFIETEDLVCTVTFRDFRGIYGSIIE